MPDLVWGEPLQGGETVPLTETHGWGYKVSPMAPVAWFRTRLNLHSRGRGPQGFSAS